MATYTVTFSNLSVFIDQIAQIQTRILDMIHTLEADTERNLAEWSSEAQEAYRTTKARWDEAGREMPILLGVMRDTADDVVNDYINAEKVGTQLFNG